MADILPELPSALRKFINLLNNDQLNLDRNLEKLNKIENSIFKSTRRNYWMTASLIFTLFLTISIYFNLNNISIINHPIYLYMVLLSILIIVMRPRKK